MKGLTRIVVKNFSAEPQRLELWRVKGSRGCPTGAKLWEVWLPSALTLEDPIVPSEVVWTPGIYGTLLFKSTADCHAEFPDTVSLELHWR